MLMVVPCLAGWVWFVALFMLMQVLVVLLNGGEGANGARILKEDTVKLMYVGIPTNTISPG